MAEMQDSWKEVASKAEALGLKLKLHLEQEKDETEARESGDTKALIDEMGQKVTDAFESMGNAAKDEAIHEDVKQMGNLFKDALMSTFTEVQNRAGAATSSSDDADFDSAVQDAKAELDETTGDESGDGDA